MFKTNTIKYLIKIFLIMFFICTSASAQDEEESRILKSILQGEGKALSQRVEDLEEELAKNKLRCQHFDNSCSGSTVLKVMGKSTYVVKILSNSETEYSNEIGISETAARISLAPQVLFSGNTVTYRYMVMEFLESPPLAQKMTWLNIDWSIMKAVISTVKSLHDSDACFPPTTTLYESARDYFDLIQRHTIPAPSGYEVVRNSFDQLMRLLVRLQHYKPCHFDLHKDNIFIGSSTVRFIDWDCAGMGNIYLELASLSLEFRFSNEDDGKMLRVYFSVVSDEEKARFYIAKTLCMGVFSVREFVRPYFGVLFPYSLSNAVAQEDYQSMARLSSMRHLRYDDVLNLARSSNPVDYDTDLKIGMLMLNEYIQRLKDPDMYYSIFLLRGSAVVSKWILLNHSTYKSCLRGFFLRNPSIIALYYNSRK